MYKSKYKKASSRITRRNKNKQLFSLFFKGSIPIVLIVGFIFLMRANFLQVKNFEIIGAEALVQEEIKSVAINFISGNEFLFIPKSNIFMVSKGKLTSILLSRFGRLEKIEVDKEFFSQKIKFNVSEREADFLWCSPQNLPTQAGECYFMNKSGLIFEKSNFSSSSFLTSSVSWIEPKNKLIFEGSLEGNPLMRNFVSSEKMQNYLKFVEILKNFGIEIISINIESIDKAIAKSDNGDIFFNPEEKDLSMTAQNVILLIKEVKSHASSAGEKNSSVQFNYIDARFGNKIYYKLY
jgi:hypothetical protein